ncbi:copper chaperone PCu(A)C [Steroidobacter sp. S1-65]|uniref:Copper chaperone PCu(A)C n=1 Tax=Steroidobacter gossypii TaxID=2805490 RepID=A0ABS1WTI8_9GAMM|nr:copper chaperone PCu(A)C [Steroidobacter gossypii]MBM0104258.1 copper chaperone PCu(A)C [Steroidobacter gossypii]
MIELRRKLIVTLFALVATACGQTVREPIVVSDAWSNATPAGATVAAAYMEITAAEADTLLSATTTVADHIEMHTSSEENGMMRMRPLATAPLEAGQPFKFAPGGAHFMLMGLRQPLPAGLRFPMVLQFEKAGTRTVQVLVVEPGTR